MALREAQLLLLLLSDLRGPVDEPHELCGICGFVIVGVERVKEGVREGSARPRERVGLEQVASLLARGLLSTGPSPATDLLPPFFNPALPPCPCPLLTRAHLP